MTNLSSRFPAAIGLSFLLSTLALSGTTARAQCMNPNLGIGTGSGSDTITLCAPLGFNFTFPNGANANAVAVDSNGRIFPVGADTTDWTATVGELLSQTTALCPLWTDQGGGPDDDVYCYSNGVDTAVITWVDANYNFGSAQFTYQVELHADGSFRFVYDERMRDVNFTADAVLIGYTDGSDISTDPGPSDWSTTLFSGPIDSGTTATGYERNGFDLSGLALDFTPNGNGGYTTSTTTCGLAFASVMGESCSNRVPTSVTFSNTGASGAYVPTLGNVPFDTNPGIAMGHFDDTMRLANLGFSLRMPDNALVNAVEVDSNGRILPVGADGSDFSPSVNELINEASGHFCAFWTDLNPGAGGDVLYYSNGSDLATVTWLDVRQFGTANTITVQAQLRRISSLLTEFTVVFEDTAEYQLTNRHIIIGTAGGSGVADPGESDLNGILAPPSATLYEDFDPATDEFDLQPIVPSAEFDFTTHPVMNSNFILTLDGMRPSNLGSDVMIGFSNLNISLAVLDMPCVLYSDNAIPAIQIGAAGATTASWTLPIMSLNTPLVLQGAVIDPGLNGLGLDLTRAVEALTGL